MAQIRRIRKSEETYFYELLVVIKKHRKIVVETSNKTKKYFIKGIYEPHVGRQFKMVDVIINEYFPNSIQVFSYYL